jgi:hypothetical protein
MIADEPDDVLTPEQIAAELRGAGIGLTKQDMQAFIANARAHERPAVRKQWALLLLVPPHCNAEVARRAADRGLLLAERVGGRWFSTPGDMQDWLKRTGRWFKSAEAEQCWRKKIGHWCRDE